MRFIDKSIELYHDNGTDSTVHTEEVIPCLLLEKVVRILFLFKL